MEIKKLDVKGIHDVFDSDMDNSYLFKDNGDVIGYACFRKTENDSIWMEYILATSRGEGKGIEILTYLFNNGIPEIQGTAIYGPHLFWESVGAEFSEEVEENPFVYDGTYFVLTKEMFAKFTNK